RSGGRLATRKCRRTNGATGSPGRYNRSLPAGFMSLTLKLRGSPAVSAFRLDKLNSRLAEIHRSLRITASEYWHFAEISQPLAAGETAVLERLLDYGEQ